MPQPLLIQSVNHVSFTVHDLPACIRFYRDVLGFVEVERPPFDFAGSWLFSYGIMVHLIQDDEPGGEKEHGEIRTRANHLALHTDDLDAAFATLDAHQIPYRKNEVPGRPIRQAFFHDPDGNHIEIGTYGPTPPQLTS